ncbi:hypothetical protein GJ744_000280 [Endocarpon pusillum]|uniref:Uncharacterized protein n=1 Tax=Endocarpon pusillum TaxID=364733 RepID=A0A8H7E920_9EURO|nr:hypothetical protein GJ744_000280 [Endocarpon pusillum]
MDFPGSTTITIDEDNGDGDDDETKMGLFFAFIFIMSCLVGKSSASDAFPRQKFETWFGTTETIKANMASAGVVLGLMPSMLSSLDPTLAVSTTLALECPFLSFLLAIAAPAFYPSGLSTTKIH